MEPVDADAAGERRWQARVAHPLRTDPGGAWAAEIDGRLVGVAQAIVRERLWVLSLLTIAPEHQSSGLGRALLERALAYGSGLEAGLITSSPDPRALRSYARAGFALRPTIEADGELDRRALPAPAYEISETTDLELAAELSRLVRGAAHTPELELWLDEGMPLLRFGDRGFAVVAPDEDCVRVLAARDEEAAQALLWAALAMRDGGGFVRIRWITAGQDWAVDVALRAGLALRGHGALFVRGSPGPLRPYVPSGAYL